MLWRELLIIPAYFVWLGMVGAALFFPQYLVGVSVPIVLIAIFVNDARMRRRRQRMAGGLCVVCGYDVRASVGRCPECGTTLTAVESNP